MYTGTYRSGIGARLLIETLLKDSCSSSRKVTFPVPLCKSIFRVPNPHTIHVFYLYLPFDSRTKEMELGSRDVGPLLLQMGTILMSRWFIVRKCHIPQWARAFLLKVKCCTQSHVPLCARTLLHRSTSVGAHTQYCNQWFSTRTYHMRNAHII